MIENQRQAATDLIPHRSSIDRLEAELTAVRRQLQGYLQLIRWRDGLLAEVIAEEIQVTFEDYQDDGLGRVAVCLEHDQVTIDLSEEDEFVPARLRIVKQLPDGETAQFAARLQANQLRYSIEYQA